MKYICCSILWGSIDFNKQMIERINALWKGSLWLEEHVETECGRNETKKNGESQSCRMKAQWYMLYWIVIPNENTTRIEINGKRMKKKVHAQTQIWALQPLSQYQTWFRIKFLPRPYWCIIIYEFVWSLPHYQSNQIPEQNSSFHKPIQSQTSIYLL